MARICSHTARCGICFYLSTVVSFVQTPPTTRAHVETAFYRHVGFLCSIVIAARDLAGAAALFSAAERGDPAIVQQLIERGADVNFVGRSGVSPVSAAAYVGNDSIVEALLARGADERAPDETGKPPIVYAAAKARLDIVKRLLAPSIDINARYPNDLTLLMWASGPDEKTLEARAIEVV